MKSEFPHMSPLIVLIEEYELHAEKSSRAEEVKVDGLENAGEEKVPQIFIFTSEPRLP